MHAQTDFDDAVSSLARGLTVAQMTLAQGGLPASVMLAPQLRQVIKRAERVVAMAEANPQLRIPGEVRHFGDRMAHTLGLLTFGEAPDDPRELM